ncbi:MAG: hypothetical protein KKE20_00290 [Nanoarchaeota archaeon]|nr:hypothetical protein [Nanoarchaeota archaeon]
MSSIKKKCFYLVVFILLFLSAIYSVSAAPLDLLLSPLAKMDIGGTYARYGFVIDSLIYFVILLGAAEVALRKQFADRSKSGAKAIVIGVGFALAFSIMFWEWRSGFRLASIWPLALALVFITFGLAFYNFIKGGTCQKAVGLLSFAFLFYFFQGLVPQIAIWFLANPNTYVRFMWAVLHLMALIALVWGVIELLRCLGVGGGGSSGGGGSGGGGSGGGSGPGTTRPSGPSAPVNTPSNRPDEQPRPAPQPGPRPPGTEPDQPRSRLGITVEITKPAADAPGDPDAVKKQGDTRPMEVAGKISGGPDEEYDPVFGIYDMQGYLMRRLIRSFDKVPKDNTVSQEVDLSSLQEGRYFIVLFCRRCLNQPIYPPHNIRNVPDDLQNGRAVREIHIVKGSGPNPPPPGRKMIIDSVTPPSANQGAGTIVLTVKGTNLDLMAAGPEFRLNSDPSKPPLKVVKAAYDKSQTEFKVDVDVDNYSPGNPTDIGLYDIAVKDTEGDIIKKEKVFEIKKGGTPPPPLPGIIIEKPVADDEEFEKGTAMIVIGRISGGANPRYNHVYSIYDDSPEGNGVVLSIKSINNVKAGDPETQSVIIPKLFPSGRYRICLWAQLPPADGTRSVPLRMIDADPSLIAKDERWFKVVDKKVPPPTIEIIHPKNDEEFEKGTNITVSGKISGGLSPEYNYLFGIYQEAPPGHFAWLNIKSYPKQPESTAITVIPPVSIPSTFPTGRYRICLWAQDPAASITELPARLDREPASALKYALREERWFKVVDKKSHDPDKLRHLIKATRNACETINRAVGNMARITPDIAGTKLEKPLIKLWEELTMENNEYKKLRDHFNKIITGKTRVSEELLAHEILETCRYVHEHHNEVKKLYKDIDELVLKYPMLKNLLTVDNLWRKDKFENMMMNVNENLDRMEELSKTLGEDISKKKGIAHAERQSSIKKLIALIKGSKIF